MDARPAPMVLAAALLAAAIGACGLIQQQPSPLVPGSQWRVTALDGQPTDRVELILTVLADSATLSSRCGASVATISAEEGGSGLAFGQFQGPAGGTACPPDVQATHEAVTEALQGVERWQAAGDATELQGDRLIRLEPQRTDT